MKNNIPPGDPNPSEFLTGENQALFAEISQQDRLAKGLPKSPGQEVTLAADQPEIADLLISDIELDSALQTREHLDYDKVLEYRASLDRGDSLPPISVVRDRDNPDLLRITDGFHRLSAHTMRGAISITAEIITLDQAGAVLLAASANRSHGLPRSQMDKRRAVALLLGNPEYTKWANRKIANALNIDDKTISAVRGQLEQAGKIEPVSVRETSNGRMQVAQHKVPKGATSAEPREQSDGADFRTQKPDHAEMTSQEPGGAEIRTQDSAAQTIRPQSVAAIVTPVVQIAKPVQTKGAMRFLRELHMSNTSLTLFLCWVGDQFRLEISTLDGQVCCAPIPLTGADPDLQLEQALKAMLTPQEASA